ncbi:MAG: hypothetical protein ACLQDY_23880 [Streptosporangiaceae bacterium]
MAGMRAGVRKLVVAYDVEHYSGRGTRREHVTQQRLSDILEFAFRESGVPADAAEVQEQGDGGLALLPTGGAVDEPRLIVGLINALVQGLIQLNEDLVEEVRIRLRVALQEGVVHPAAHGYVGPAVIEACRLRDADSVRSALAGSDAPLVVVVADGLYRDVLSQGYHGLSASTFAPVEVQVKSYSGKAWTYLPGGARRVGSDTPAGQGSDQALTSRPILREFLDNPPDAW